MHVDVGQYAVEKDLCEGRDEELDCMVIDEDQVTPSYRRIVQNDFAEGL